MKRFFSPDNFYWRCFDKMADVLGLSLLWFLLSLPVVTTGAATTALYDSTSRCVRGGEPGVYSRFFRTFRESFKLSTLCALVFGGALALLAAGYRIVSALAQANRPLLVLAAVYYVLCACVMGYLCWLFPLLSRYEYSFGGLCRTALQFWFAHFPSTLAMAVLLEVCVETTAQLLFPVCVLPALLALADTIFVERAFKKHAPPARPEENGFPDPDPKP